jgi:hypothetical protein
MKHLIAVCLFLLLLAAMASAQGNGFSFQGRLNDGTNPANGSYDLQFKLYDAVTGGNQIGTMVDRPNTVLANGVFSVVLDFGASAFNNPASIFIEIAVRPNGSPNAYTILGPRQQLTVVPYAVRATNATNADLATNAVNATNADRSSLADLALVANDAHSAKTAVSADNAHNADYLGGTPPSGYAKLNFANSGYLQASGDLYIDGNARQLATSNGLPKAMLSVTDFGGITRCYNSTTNSSITPCGFSITKQFDGVLRIDFGFPVSNRFTLVTAEYIDSSGQGLNNGGANYRAFSTNVMEVFTFVAGNSADTTSRPFTIVIF